MEYAIGTALVAAIESVVSCAGFDCHWQQRLTKTDNNKMNAEEERRCIVVSSLPSRRHLRLAPRFATLWQIGGGAYLGGKTG